ncbi:MAG: twin-arginine translocase TatA/TatE family subunit [Novosphingobium sp.]|jgi:sec-independent protein translocase protein TatA|nr:twin-arginine translocase TatA/TatE family subunit [Novosphingobium sp.]
MMGLSVPHLLIVALVVLVLFGRGRISEMMGDFGKGIKSFKQGMADEENKPAPPPPAQIPAQPAARPQVTLNGDTVVDTNQPAG